MGRQRAAITVVYELNQRRGALPNAQQSAYLRAGLGLSVIPHVPATSRNPLSDPNALLLLLHEQNTTPMHESPMAEGISARDFLERELRANPDVAFADVQERGRRLGLNIPPFLYGSARRALGLPSRRDLVEPTVPAPAPVAAAAEPTARFRDDFQPEETSVIEPLHEEMDEVEAEVERPVVAAAATAQKSTAFQFAVDTLKLSPDLSFQDLKLRASMAGLKMQPIIYGRAKALLGLVPTKPRQPRAPKIEAPRLLRQVDSAADFVRTAPAAAPAPAATPRTAFDSIGSLEQLISALRELESERQRLRATLAAIQEAVDEALADPLDD